VPAGGQTSAVFAWKAPTTQGAYTVTVTTALTNTALIDANPTNNTRSTTVKVT
jgi:hypothetical protein